MPLPVDNKAGNNELVVFSRNANRASANLNMNSGASLGGNVYIPVVGNAVGGSGVVPSSGVSSGGVLPARNVRTDVTTAVPNIPAPAVASRAVREERTTGATVAETGMGNSRVG